MTKTYSIPAESRFAVLRREAEHYLHPAGFFEGASTKSQLHLVVQAGAKEDESYFLERRAKAGSTTITIRAEGLRGASHGFHHVLQLLGFGFSFFADAKPEKIIVRWPYSNGIVRVRPEFAVRGFLPWHNFLNSPTTWNFADYQRHLLTLWRWGGNTVIFRNDNTEPLAAIRDGKGNWIRGGRMATSIDAPWGGTKGIPVTRFAHGTGKFFKDARGGAWGAGHCFKEDPIQAAQEEFAKVCGFARSIGLDIAFGIDALKEDPTIPGIKQLVGKRIAHILRAYPDLHTLCLWHPEGHGQLGWPSAVGSPGYAELYRKHGKAFGYLRPASGRLADAVRTAEWFQFVYKAAKELRPSIRIAFSGWGGDKWMRWGDYWKGLHEILSTDVIFAQLDNINPLSQEGVSRASVGLSDQRTLWSIPWIESDASWLGRASQWHPQDGVAKMQELARSAKKLGYAGLLGIHWQTAGAELNASCLAAAGWNTKEGAEAFCLRYSRAFFSSKTGPASRVARILTRLEKLGPGWTGTGQQIECSTFAWNPHPAITTGKLLRGLRLLWQNAEKSRDELFGLPDMPSQIWLAFDGLLWSFNQKRSGPRAFKELQRFRKNLAALKLTRPHARRLLATMDFVIAYEKIRVELMPGGKLKQQQELLKESASWGLKPDPRLAAEYKKGLRRVEEIWKQVFEAQASRLDTRGDLGNLANINLKAYQAWARFRDEKNLIGSD